jgi:hypothetical protein
MAHVTGVAVMGGTVRRSLLGRFGAFGVAFAIVLVLGAGLIIGASLSSGGELTAESASPEAKPEFSQGSAASANGCESEGEPLPFGAYLLGEEFQGLHLTHVERVCYPQLEGELVQANYVTFIYGSCELDTMSRDSGCAPPLEVQNWASCSRNASSYDTNVYDDIVEETKQSVRGVPAARAENGSRLELYSEDTTVIVFGSNRELVDAASDALMAHDPEVEPSIEDSGEAGLPGTVSDDLPAPSQETLEGGDECQGSRS